MLLKTILWIIGIIFWLFVIILVANWRRIMKIARFRKNIKQGDYCRFKLGNEMVTGFVISVDDNGNNLHVHHYGVMHKLKYYEIYP